MRAANAIFDDTNPATLPYWKYPDTGVWDPERNTNEFIEQMRVWRTYGINAVDVSFMGRPSLSSLAMRANGPSPGSGLGPSFLRLPQRSC